MCLGACPRGLRLNQTLLAGSRPLTRVGEDMSLQLIWPVELLTAACVCPRTQSHWSGDAYQVQDPLAGPSANPEHEDTLVHPNGWAKKQGRE